MSEPYTEQEWAEILAKYDTPVTSTPPKAAGTTTNRIMPKTKAPKGPNGERLCRWCHGAVKPPKRTFCCEECIHEWRIRRDPSYVRTKLQERDKGVCTLCGIDTSEVKAALRELLNKAKAGSTYGWWVKDSAWNEFYIALGVNGRRSLWDADHITPVVEGGGACGLENYRTLCIWCHKRETAALAKRRSKRGAAS